MSAMAEHDAMVGVSSPYPHHVLNRRFQPEFAKGRDAVGLRGEAAWSDG